MNRCHQLQSRFTGLQRGQTMAEYGLIAALIAVVAIAAWAALGTSIETTINGIAGCI
jgi:Flp pilus assembly pilin Flp